MDKKELLDKLRKAKEAGAAYAREKNLPPDEVMVSLGGGRPCSVQELNDTGEVLRLLCTPASQGPALIEGSTREEACDACGQEVWLSPEVKKMFDRVRKKLIFCTDCAARDPRLLRED